MAANAHARALEEKLTSGTAAITVMGMGYVGLPLALTLVGRGYEVHALDIKAEKVEALRAGRSYLRDVPAAALQTALTTGRLLPTTDPAVLARSDVVLICVPTPFTPQKEPDTSFITDAVRQITTYSREEQLVILRSTSYPGTTEDVVRPALERTGLRVGEDVFLAFVPERIDPGNSEFPMNKVPVVVGGCEPESTRLAARLFERVGSRVVSVSSPSAAEMTKLLENVFRNINIALVNQVAQLCDRMGLDVWEVVDAAATKPYGFMSFRPGLVGGHCIPVDPYYLAWKAREYDFHMDFVELAARVNDDMPYYVMNKLLMALRENGNHQGPERILVLGVAFKKDVDDARYSPALKIIELLRRRKIAVLYHDPYVAEVQVNGEVFRSEPLTAQLLEQTDCTLILADHSCLDYAAIVDHARLVFDTRNVTKAITLGREKIIKL